nr:MAG TPA: hypothetical protein [Caudoviricetes sp.]DAT83133.1 MAG TPA: hypothetical protein [Caudoviricetes sp.]
MRLTHCKSSQMWHIRQNECIEQKNKSERSKI